MTKRSIGEDIREALEAPRARPALEADPVTLKAVQGWLSADAEFNRWFLLTTKRALADDDLMELLDGYRESQETMEKAWSSYEDEVNGTKLCASIAISIARMHALMNR